MKIKRDLQFREQLKADIAKQVLDVQAETKEQQLEKADLGLRMLKFFQFEQDEEFEKMFDEFCKRRIKGEKNNGER